MPKSTPVITARRTGITIVKSAKTATTAQRITTAAGCMAPERCRAATPAASQKDQASPLARWYARKHAAPTKITEQATNAARVMIISSISSNQFELTGLAERRHLEAGHEERRETLDQQLVVVLLHRGDLRE